MPEELEVPALAWDYHEVLVLVCKVPDCDWEEDSSWSELDWGRVPQPVVDHWKEKHA